MKTELNYTQRLDSDQPVDMNLGIALTRSQSGLPRRAWSGLLIACMPPVFSPYKDV